MSNYILIVLLLCSFGFINKSVSAQDTKPDEWTWRKGTDPDSVKRTREELDNLLASHQKWLDRPIVDLSNLTFSEYKKYIEDNLKIEGYRLYLNGADLHGADLKKRSLSKAILIYSDLREANFDSSILIGTNFRNAKLDSAKFNYAFLDSAKLSDADLRWTVLRDATLRSAILSNSDLTNSNLIRSNLRYAILYKAKLTGALLGNADLTGAQLGDTKLDSVNLVSANLKDSHLIRADLSGSYLIRAILIGANLRDANLEKANLRSAILNNADFSGVNLQSTIFEPESLPDINGIAKAKNLDKLSYKSNPSKLVELREEFSKKGYKQQERKIICALRRHDDNFVEEICFDWTSEYGSNLYRPWWILVFIFFVCGLLYYLSMLKEYNSGIHLVTYGKIEKKVEIEEDNEDEEDEEDEEKLDRYIYEPNDITWLLPIHINNTVLKGTFSKYYSGVPMWFRLFWWSFFFSAISTFNIGFRDVSFGKWLKMLTQVDFDLKPFGWVRVLSGFQALVSVYLIALWILSFAGTPFK